jgi:glucoamylase
LRIILAAEAIIVWSRDGWAHTHRSETTHQSELDLWFADFPTGKWPGESIFAFTCFWEDEQRWEGRNWEVSVV